MKILSLGVCLLLLLGVVFRRRPRVHVPLMVTAFLVDIGMLLYIELTRKAIATVVGGPHEFVMVHATISTLVLVAYGFQILSGLKILKGRARQLNHRYAAVVLLLLRFSNFGTSLFVEGFIHKDGGSVVTATSDQTRRSHRN